MQNKSISLYYKEGRSDKEYHVELLQKDGGFVVNFRYGRRGEALKVGTKTDSPLPYDKAKAAYDKLVSEKTKKGYSTGEAGAAYQDTSLQSRYCGFLPQLANAIDEGELQLRLSDDAFCVQEKFNGERRLIRKGCLNIEGEVHGVNRKGLMIPLPQVIVDFSQKLEAQHFVIDGELIGTQLYAFDLLEANGKDLRTFSFQERSNRLLSLIGGREGEVSPVATAYGTAAKRSLFDTIKGRKGEGAVFKRWKAPYESGRPASGGDWLKFKFVETATCRVAGVNSSKRSVSLELYDEKDIPQSVGKVTIPPNHPVPKAGTLVEVRYLYAHREGSLYQPVYLGERRDLEMSAARLSQLKYKPDASDEEDEG